ncbi:conserved oligomeric Golgi complex subunit 7-like [Phragmites australis]|uniref:conserved oligomeric Golgi complex subunit 7-like n=1 Tax=Phragmites australis TaxID=29695 RepID=UPI002D78043B|nr:conserved oligomeric Golgi complex subunit 7-like [Phragmites australis]
MVVVDASEFGAEGFDPKRWINAALDARHPSEPLDRFLAGAEERLLAAADDAAAELERDSGDALRRVPLACRDALRLRDDAVALRSHLASVLQSLSLAEGTSAESITALARIDTVKQRMEAAYATLQDAAGLAQLSQSVEDVFSSGNLPKAAETLATMRHCLSAVGEVAEFANVRKQLEVLEERLDEMVQPRLVDALSNRKVDAVQDLRGILIRIGRFKSLEVQYTKSHVKPLKKLWEDFDLKQRASRVDMEKYGGESVNSLSFSSWLPNFYDETLLYLEQEWKWCLTAFPEEYKSLVPKVLVETMSELNSSFVSRVNIATGDVVPETRLVAKGILDVLSGDLPKSTKLQNKHLQALIELHNMTGTFARNIQNLFSESDLSVVLNTLKAMYSPYETFKARYGQMERAILSAEMGGIDIRGAVSRGVGAQGIELSETVRRMEESIPQMIVLLEAAVERCISLTGGSEADELILALDDIMLQYISNLQDILKSLRMVCGLDAHSDALKKDAGLEKKEAQRVVDVSEEEEWSIVQGALQILTVADCLTSRTSVFEASLRATLARIGTNFSLSGFGSSLDKSPAATSDENVEVPLGGRAALDISAIRLSDLPDKSKKLFTVLDQSKDPRFHALPLTSQRVAAFSDTVNELVYDVLISKVRQRLSEIARLPIWSSVEEQGALPLPSFSAYPQAYVTNVGEYLLTLPQQLEPLAEGISGNESGNDEAQFFATEWIFKVAEGATALFMEQLRGIHYITDRGAQQLAADIEYLNNVLSALSMPIPPFLSTFHACVSTPRDQVRRLIKSDGGSQLDLPTAHLVCKIRRISLD